MESRFDEAEAARLVREYGERWGDDLALRVYTSRLLGAEPALVLHGGGNTSVKSTAKEITGESIDVLAVKGSGWDLRTIEPEGFPICRLDALRRQCALDAMTDEQMVAALRSQMLDPASPTPSVEALLHAFLPGRFVDHTHANAVLAVVDQPDGAERARAVWGDTLVFVPYVMPGFALARRIVELGDELGNDSVIVLDKHGIFTWGETARESYERMIAAVSLAETYVDEESSTTSVTRASIPSTDERRRRQRALSPILRGALARGADGQRWIAEWRDDDRILSLLSRSDAERQTRIGTATPDHVIRTKPFPLWLDDPGDDEKHARAGAEKGVADYAAWYEQYFEENVGPPAAPRRRARGGRADARQDARCGARRR